MRLSSAGLRPRRAPGAFGSGRATIGGANERSPRARAPAADWLPNIARRAAEKVTWQIAQRFLADLDRSRPNAMPIGRSEPLLRGRAQFQEAAEDSRIPGAVLGSRNVVSSAIR